MTSDLLLSVNEMLRDRSIGDCPAIIEATPTDTAFHGKCICVVMALSVARELAEDARYIADWLRDRGALDILIQRTVYDDANGIGVDPQDPESGYDWSLTAFFTPDNPLLQGLMRRETPASAPSILRAAAQAIDDRATLRDCPGGERSMARCVTAFNALTGHNVSETEGWHFMSLLKLARATAGGHHADDHTDHAAYAALAGESADREASA